MDSRYKVWFAKGFTARAKNVDFPGSTSRKVPGTKDLPGFKDPYREQNNKAVSFKNDHEREQAFREGWTWANGIFHYNKVPFTVEEVIALENHYWAEATGKTAAKKAKAARAEAPEFVTT